MDSRIERLETEVEIIKQDRHNLTLDIALMKKDHEITKKSIENTQKTMERIEKKLDEHFLEPVRELNKLKWTVISFIVLAVVGYFVTFTP